MSYTLSFSKAILVVIFIADKYRQGQYEYLSTAVIAQVLKIPKPTLVKILQNLGSAGIVETKEGKQGGIRLGRKPEEISVLDILEATERKPLFHANFDIQAVGTRPDRAQEVLTALFGQAEAKLKNTLAAKSIGQILAEMGSK